MVNFATKYRPKDFQDVIGQQYIIESLSNQIEKNTLKQVYLFSGASGVGKTTLARIMANKLNAEIKEIDAASNNGVDDIRSIRQDTQSKPMFNDYKLYILDEAHMLSNSAFNSMLKLLEEPPEYVIIILCTTEPNKIIPTVRTRCQQFHFKKVSDKEIIEKLKSIYPDQSEEVYNYIAEISNGCVRDAISYLEIGQNCMGKLTKKYLQNVLGVTGDDFIKNLIQGILDHSSKDILYTINILDKQGMDIRKVLLDTLRYIVRARRDSILYDKEDIPEYDTLYKDLYDLYNQVKYDNNCKILVEGVLLCMANKAY